MKIQSKKWSALLMVLVLLGFIAWSLQRLVIPNNNNNHLLAKVDQKKITNQQLQLAKGRYLALHNSNIDKQTLNNIILNRLIQQTILQQYFQKYDYVVTNNAIHKNITHLNIFQDDNNKFSQQYLEKYLRVLKYSFVEFQQKVALQLTIQKLQNAIYNSTIINNDSLKDAWLRQNQKRKFAYIILDSKNFQASKITTNQIKQYYDNHPFKEDSHLSISYIELTAKTKKFSQIRTKLEQLNYENPHSLMILAQKMKLPIHKTALFSKNTGNANDLSQYSIIRKAAFSDIVLKQNNNSDLLTLANGNIIVLRINKYQHGSKQDLSKVRPAIIKILQQQQQITKMQKIIDDYLKTNENSIIILKKISKKYNVKIQQQGYATKQQLQYTSAKIIDAAFNLYDKKLHELKIKQRIILIALIGVKNTKKQPNNLELTKLKKQLALKQSKLEINHYYKTILNSAKIKLY